MGSVLCGTQSNDALEQKNQEAGGRQPTDTRNSGPKIWAWDDLPSRLRPAFELGDIVAVWREADEIELFESAWVFDHLYP